MAATEESLAEDMAARALLGSAEEEAPKAKFEFDSGFQTKVAALALRDAVFNERTEGLVQPEHFENIAEAALVNIVQRYFKKYKRTPDTVTLARLIKDDIDNKVIRKDMVGDVKNSFRTLRKVDIGDRDYVVDQVSEFARYQSVTQVILESVELLERGDYGKIQEKVKQALEVGANEASGGYDYWAEIESRTHIRKEEAAGTMRKRGITTGIRVLDKLLYQHGWGRKELSMLMGGPKVGKSTALGMFAKNASLAGYDVLVVTLEVASEIIGERLDASVADVAVAALGEHILEVKDKITLAGKKAGKLLMHEFPTGTLTPAMLRRVMSRYRAQGQKFDLVVVDYADLMAPDYRTNDPIENSKSIYQGLRAISQEEDVAMLSATQTNREGAKSAVAKMEHVAEDFNRVRIADILISINRTEDEKARNEARLFFAASRNQKGDFTIRIQQDLERMIFLKKILGVE